MLLRCDAKKADLACRYCPAYFAGRWPEWCACMNQRKTKRDRLAEAARVAAVTAAWCFLLGITIMSKGRTLF